MEWDSLIVFFILARIAAQAGEELPDISGERQQNSREYCQKTCQSLEQHTTGIGINIHLSLLSHFGNTHNMPYNQKNDLPIAPVTTDGWLSILMWL